MSTPTFTNLDIGLPGGGLYPDHARATCQVAVGPLQVARSSVVFPGVPATLSINMGPQQRTVTWRVVLRCDTASALRTIEANIEAKLTAGTVGTLTDSLGKAYQNVIVRNYEPAESWDTIRGGELAGWVRREARITFAVLTP